MGYDMNQCDGCQSGMFIEDGLHYYKGKVHMSCQSKRYVSEQNKIMSRNIINSAGTGGEMKTLQHEIVAILQELDLFISISSSCAARDLSLKLMSLVEKVESARCENCESFREYYEQRSNYMQETTSCYDGFARKPQRNDGCWHFKQKVK